MIKNMPPNLQRYFVNHEIDTKNCLQYHTKICLDYQNLQRYFVNHRRYQGDV